MALKFHLEERQGLNEWLRDLADEEPDAAELPQKIEVPEEAEIQPEHALFWRAWHTLRHERHYGAMGGESPILWTALDVYARRYGIEGSAFDDLAYVIREMDGVYLAWSAERQKKLLEDSKRGASGAPPS